MDITLLYVVLSAATVLYLITARHRRGSLPPGPVGLPLVGSLPFLDPNLHTYFAGMAAKHGPIYSIWLGSKLGIVITSPALAREVLHDQDLVFANRDTPQAALLLSYGGGQNIVWNPVGPKWRMLRRVCVREMLSPAGLDNVHALYRREFRTTLRHLHAQSGTPMDVGKQMFLTTMNVITSMLWGTDGGKRNKCGQAGARTRVVKPIRPEAIESFRMRKSTGKEEKCKKGERIPNQLGKIELDDISTI